MDAQQFDDLMVRVAWLYHQRDWTQDQIARRYRVSRGTIARLLQRASQEGLVKVTFAAQPEHRMRLEEALCQKYSLVETILVDSSPDDAARQTALATATAAYLERSLEDGKLVGVDTISRTLHEMATLISPPRKCPGCVFVEMLGGMVAEDPRFDTYNVSWELARRYGALARHLFAPAILGSVEVRDAMLNDLGIAKTMEMAANSDVSLLAIGDVGSCYPMLVRIACSEESDVTALQCDGAVGEILGRVYDVAGNTIRTPIDDRILGLNLDQVRALRFVVAVGGGKIREAAILGALRQRFIKVLVTDQETGEALLDKP
jgi:DNA-binding transcriptional regulator LsrR (DeoR family)